MPVSFVQMYAGGLKPHKHSDAIGDGGVLKRDETRMDVELVKDFLRRFVWFKGGMTSG